MLGKIEGRRKGTREDEMVGWYHRLDGHEFEQALGHGEGQGSLERCSLCGHKELDTTEHTCNTKISVQLNYWTVNWSLIHKTDHHVSEIE